MGLFIRAIVLLVLCFVCFIANSQVFFPKDSSFNHSIVSNNGVKKFKINKLNSYLANWGYKTLPEYQNSFAPILRLNTGILSDGYETELMNLYFGGLNSSSISKRGANTFEFRHSEYFLGLGLEYFKLKDFESRFVICWGVSRSKMLLKRGGWIEK